VSINFVWADFQVALNSSLENSPSDYYLISNELSASKGAPDTGISIVRETSPTPSITEEIEQTRSENHDRRRQEYLSAHAGEEFDEEEIENQMRLITGAMSDDEIPHIALTVETFVPPSQARKFVNDVLRKSIN
jgi:hypothetical protein